MHLNQTWFAFILAYLKLNQVYISPSISLLFFSFPLCFRSSYVDVDAKYFAYRLTGEVVNSIRLFPFVILSPNFMNYWIQLNNPSRLHNHKSIFDSEEGVIHMPTTKLHNYIQNKWKAWNKNSAFLLEYLFIKNNFDLYWSTHRTKSIKDGLLNLGKWHQKLVSTLACNSSLIR